VIPSAIATHRLIRAVAGTALVLVVSGCASTSPSATPGHGASRPASASPTAIPAESTSPTASTRPKCPVPYHGDCLGPVPAGTYTTVQFQPPITYAVPAGGWFNSEDLPGLFTLIPPGFSIGVNSNEPTGDYILIATSVVAANADCTESEQPGVGQTAAALAAEFAQRPGLTTTTPTPVSVGGLQGLVLDVRMADGWTQTCFYSGGKPAVPLIRGVGQSSGLDNPICDPGCTTRVYLLDGSATTLAIELGDNSGGTHLDGYSAIVDELIFGN
jgi:hypothetical protein